MGSHGNMTQSDRHILERRFMAILHQHKGMIHAISVPAMAQALGLGDGKAGQRQAQHIKRALVDAGELVGSSCGRVSGWYLMENEDEIHATLRQYASRWHSIGMLMQRTRAKLREYRAPQLTMFEP